MALAMVMASSAAGAGEVRQQSAKAIPALVVVAEIIFMDASLKDLCLQKTCTCKCQHDGWQKIERGVFAKVSTRVERAISPKI
jgi:hypothetical protein